MTIADSAKTLGPSGQVLSLSVAVACTGTEVSIGDKNIIRMLIKAINCRFIIKTMPFLNPVNFITEAYKDAVRYTNPSKCYFINLEFCMG